MISGQELLKILIENDFRFFTGIPCSILRDFLLALKSNKKKTTHIIPSNEGEAMGIAAGYYLSTGKVPVVYLQNSGLGNILDPLTSLFAKEVYNIPVLLLVSWRGEPDKKDEPQHIGMGNITEKFFNLIGIPYVILSTDKIKAKREILEATDYFKKNKLPYAIIIKRKSN